MHLAIDASNIRQGGGITHLSQLLEAANPADAGITHITVWTCSSTAAQLPNHSFLTKLSPKWTEGGLIKRLFGQQMQLGQDMVSRGCDILFSPGGTVPFKCKVPVVTMSQNLLPFEPEEALRFGKCSWMRLKMWILRQSQLRSFKSADGLIFLTQYARKVVMSRLEKSNGLIALIPHGIESRFSSNPKPQKSKEEYSSKRPFNFLYVSILMPYKHQIQVAQAARELYLKGYPIKVRFVGPDWGWYGLAFRKLLDKLDSQNEFLFWVGDKKFSELHSEYQFADAFLFASSCENLPNIMIEAMAAGLPIACSKMGPMPEVLGNAGIYFDPLDSKQIANSMRKLIDSLDLREYLAAQASESSKKYSWHECAKETFKFIAAVAAQRGALKVAQK
jgi:glycosyltransferase involved in cell wall biosynthesis